MLDSKQVPQVECSICCDTYSSTESLSVYGDAVCPDCFENEIKPRFVAACGAESHYPVTWGSKELNIDTYRLHFDRGFVASWNSKLREYHTPIPERIYCTGPSSEGRCNRFLGSKKTTSSSGISCSKCRYYTCTRCDAAFASTHDWRDHQCEKPVKVQDDSLAGLKRGMDYQKCPKCYTAVQLTEACNHITCTSFRCSTHFCYICGEAVQQPLELHFGWQFCPLYGQPDARRKAVIQARLDARDLWARFAEQRRREREEAQRQRDLIRRLQQEEYERYLERAREAAREQVARRVRAEPEQKTIIARQKRERRLWWAAFENVFAWVLVVVVTLVMLVSGTGCDDWE